MSLSDHVNVQIAIQSGALKLPGFGRALVLATPGDEPAGFTDRRRIYTEAADMLDDDWTTSDEEYLMVLAHFSQRPRPKDVMVGRRNAAVAQVNTILVTAGTDGDYTINLNGTAYTHAAAGQTDAQIAAALRALLDAGDDVPGNVTLGGVDPTITLTSVTAGIPMVVSVTGPAITNTLTTPNHGIPEDLVLVTDEDPDWYCLLIPEADRLHIVRAVAPTIEAQNRIALVRSNQAAILSAAYNPADIDADIASELKGLGYLRTSLWFHSSASAFIDAAVAGRMLPALPGSATWKFKALAGIAVDSFSATERTNLLGKNANGYEELGGRGYSFDGTTAVGEWIDVVHGIDRLYSRIQELIFGAQLANDKIPYTQQGLNLLGSLVEAALQESVAAGFIARTRTLDDGSVQSPAFTVTVPNIADISSSDRESRVVPSGNAITFEATLAGAIHVVNVVGSVAF
jgi:hypothetical protein